MKEFLDWNEIKHLRFLMHKDEYRFNCVFCPSDDSGYHLYVNRDKKVFHCFKCGARGVLKDKTEGHSLVGFNRKAISYYGKQGLHGLDLSDILPHREKLLVKSLPRCRPLYEDRDEYQAKKYIQYLDSRNISNTEYRENKIRYTLDREGIYTNSLVFPVGHPKNPEYFVCRKIDGSEPKYVNAPWPKDGVLYRPVRNRGAKETPYLVICEGVFDALKIMRVAKVVALLGKEATREQITRLAEMENRFLICLDSDAESYAIKLHLALKTKVENYEGQVVTLPHGKDPGSLDHRRLEEIFHGANLQLCSRSRERSGT